MFSLALSTLSEGPFLLDPMIGIASEGLTSQLHEHIIDCYPKHVCDDSVVGVDITQTIWETSVHIIRQTSAEDTWDTTRSSMASLAFNPVGAKEVFVNQISQELDEVL